MVVTMVSREEFNAKLDAALAVLTTEIEQIKAAIEAKVPESVDLSPEMAKLDALTAAIANIIPDETPVA